MEFKFKDNQIPKMKFGDLRSGLIFAWNDNTYLKVREEFAVNTIHLEQNRPTHFEYDTKVIRLFHKLEISTREY